MTRQLFGKQQNWQSVKQTTDMPIITIITATFNVADCLHYTYESIKKQNYPYIQWIVVDGNSKDDTVELLKQYSDVIDIWFSEPDTGVYNAWNKVLQYIAGEWVQFLGAGDELYEVDTIKKVVEQLKNAYPEYRLAYGKVKHISEKKRLDLFETGETWDKYEGQWDTYRPSLPIHSGIYQHKELFELVGEFDEQYKIVADNVFLLKALKYSSFKFLPFVVDIMPLGGLTGQIDSYRIISKETKIAVRRLNLVIPKNKYFIDDIRYSVKTIILYMMGKKNFMIMVDTLRDIFGKNKIWTIDWE